MSDGAGLVMPNGAVLSGLGMPNGAVLSGVVGLGMAGGGLMGF
jgi:hypothetical protein